MSLHDAILLSVGERFCGPPGSGNGGYVCGLIGNALNRVVTVRLNRPVPLETPLELLTLGDGQWLLEEEGRGLAQVRAASLVLDVPAAPTYVQALDASIHFSGFRNHPCPGCFVCGTQRAHGDGLRLFAAHVPDSRVAAAPWLPDASLAGEGDKVAPEFMAAALDCPGFFAIPDAPTGGCLLGEFTARIDRCVHVDEPCVVVGWQLARDGRKHTVGTAVFDEDGELAAVATGLWIEPRPAT
jgi:hypothetical protein